MVTPTIKFFHCYLLHCTLATVMHHNVHIWYAGYLVCDPVEVATQRSGTTALHYYCFPQNPPCRFQIWKMIYQLKFICNLKANTQNFCRYSWVCAEQWKSELPSNKHSQERRTRSASFPQRTPETRPLVSSTEDWLTEFLCFFWWFYCFQWPHIQAECGVRHCY